MKYAHLADLHLGSWREPKMRDISTKVFLTAIDDCIQKQVDFVLFAGDLFNTSMPAIDTLKIVTKKLKELKDQNIPLYAIAGSHDFSPSGKTMLDVLENAGLLTNVCKGTVNPETKKLELKLTIDPKTQTKITGIIGRRGLLDKTYYENLDRGLLEQQPGYKIFMFHTTLTELKPKHLEMLDSQPASFLPKNFNYYAGGHIHHPTKLELPEYGTLTYTGALFPNNFSELERYSHGGYYLIEINDNQNNFDQLNKKIEQNITWIPIKTIEHQKYFLNCDEKTPEDINLEILQHFSNQNLSNTVVTMRFQGKMKHGKTNDINFKNIFDQLYQQSAYFIMKNTNKLSSKDFEEIKVSNQDYSTEEIEDKIIKEHLQQFSLFDKETELQLIKNLIQTMNTKKYEGEKSYDFQERMFKEINNLIKEK